MMTRLYRIGLVGGIGLVGLLWLTLPVTAGGDRSMPLPQPTLVPAAPTPTNNPPPAFTRTEALVIGGAGYAEQLSEAERAERLKSGLPVPSSVRVNPALAPNLDRPSRPLPKLLAPRDYVDHWVTLYGRDFERPFPDEDDPCWVADADELPEEHWWGNDDYHSYKSEWGVWPAAGGGDGVDPEFAPYPNGVKTRIFCGPFDLSQAYNAMTEFMLWRDLPDPDDQLFFGVSGDGVTYDGYSHSGVITDWVRIRSYYPDWRGDDTVWVMWQFKSDASQNAAGPWLDNISIQSYTKPTGGCALPDPGGKGLNLPPYVDHGAFDWQIPILQDVQVVNMLEESKVNWARLEFSLRTDATGIVDYKDYDLLLDTLCAHGLPALGLVDYRTLERQDWDTDEYRLEFTRVVSDLVEYFDDRIGAWEVWNEPDYAEYRLEPDVYARLLAATYSTIRAAEPGDTVVFGGLGGADPNTADYLEAVYGVGVWVGPNPFDVFALHPYISMLYRYPDNRLMLDPRDYMRYESPTIIQKFLAQLTAEGDDNKPLWATELGWNSAKGVPAAENCPAIVEELVTPVQQADYLNAGFDILFNEPVWAPGSPAIAKVFWYQFQDFGTEVDCNPTGMETSHSRPLARNSALNLAPLLPDVVPWSFGLYDSDRNPKLSQCYYRYYPVRPTGCYKIYLPMTLKR